MYIGLPEDEIRAAMTMDLSPEDLVVKYFEGRHRMPSEEMMVHLSFLVLDLVAKAVSANNERLAAELGKAGLLK